MYHSAWLFTQMLSMELLFLYLYADSVGVPYRNRTLILSAFNLQIRRELSAMSPAHLPPCSPLPRSQTHSWKPEPSTHLNASFLNYIHSFYFVGVLPAWMYIHMCITCECDALGGQRASGSLDLEFLVVVNHCVGARN